VADNRSSLPDIALSVGNNTFWCGRIPLIFPCSLRFISKFSPLLSNRSSLNLSFCFRRPHPVPLRHLTDARFVGRLLWNIHSSANVQGHLPPLAFGTKACPAGDVPKVPKAWWLGEPFCSHFSSFILRKASIRKFTILLWQMSDHLSLTSLCRSSIIPFGAVGFRSSSAAQSGSSQNSPAALRSVVAKFFMLDRATPPFSTPPPH